MGTILAVFNKDRTINASVSWSTFTVYTGLGNLLDRVAVEVSGMSRVVDVSNYTSRVVETDDVAALGHSTSKSNNQEG
jgi:hypothetical protein